MSKNFYENRLVHAGEYITRHIQSVASGVTLVVIADVTETTAKSIQTHALLSSTKDG